MNQATQYLYLDSYEFNRQRHHLSGEKPVCKVSAQFFLRVALQQFLHKSPLSQSPAFPQVSCTAFE